MAHVAGMLARLARLAALVGALGACAKDGPGANGTTVVPSEAGEDGGESDGTDSGLDGGSRTDASKTVDGPGALGGMCTFNRDCHLALRCDCNETAGCACKAGARGTGKNGVDPCTSGDDCASSVCVEGPPDSGSFCTDECESSNDCTGVLPLCSDIAFVGRICIRTAPQ
jgi:hypothetical protein